MKIELLSSGGHRRVLHIQIALADQEIEESLELSLPEAPGGSGMIPCECLKKLEYLI